MFRPSCRRFFRPRRPAAAAWIVLSAITLSACTATIPGPSGGPQAVQPPAQTVPPPQAAPTTPPAAVKVPIALLLPLSGPNAALGHAMLDAAQMALYEVADERLELIPHDTKGSPEEAAKAADAARAEGARLIVGPLLAAEVQAVKPVARAASIPVLAFSTSTQLAGDGTYLIGFLPRAEIERVASFAHAKGANHFGVLAPRTTYGEIAVEALRETTQKAGASLDRIDYYDAGVTDLSPVVQRFAAANGEINAVLLPEGGTRLRTLAPLLPYYDVDPDKVHFLGTGLWDETGLGSEPSLVNGWYAAPPPTARAGFEKRFRDLYRHAPPRLATLAYDATALAAVLARRPSGPDFSASALTDPSGFAGVDGIFRLRPDGLVQRGLAVLEVHREGNVVIDPAPETFQAIGY